MGDLQVISNRSPEKKNNSSLLLQLMQGFTNKSTPVSSSRSCQLVFFWPMHESQQNHSLFTIASYLLICFLCTQSQASALHEGDHSEAWGLCILYVYLGFSASQSGSCLESLVYASTISYCSQDVRGFPPSADLSVHFSSPAFHAGSEKVNVAFSLSRYGLVPFSLQLVGKELWHLLQLLSVKSCQSLSCLLLQGNWKVFLG